MGQAKERLDGQLFKIYGDKAREEWMLNKKQDFITVPFDETRDNRGIEINKASAMSLYLMTQMDGTYQDLLKMGMDETWLSEFKRGEKVNFSKQDYEFMASIRETLDWFNEMVGPKMEKLTNRPYRGIENYFMTSRFLFGAQTKGGIAETSSIINEMLGEGKRRGELSDIKYLKQRTKNTNDLMIPDIFEAVSYYAQDMTHFLAYGEYVQKLESVFLDPAVQKIIQQRHSVASAAVIREHIDMLAKGSMSRDADRAAMSGIYWLLGNYAKNKLASPKNLLRQVSGIAASMDMEGASPVKLAQAVWDLKRAKESGELANLLDTQYMRTRFEGLYDIAVRYIEEMTKTGKVRSSVNETIHKLTTAMPRYGDRIASVAVGWMIYRDRVAQGKSKEDAVIAAMSAIEDSQQSMDPGKTPVAYNRSTFFNRLLTLFRRTPGIYLDRYIRMHKDRAAGRISNKQFIRSMITFHAWIPLFEVLITAGKFEKDETLLAMAAGPLAYHLIIGGLIRSVVAAVYEGVADGSDIPFYLRDADDSTLVGSFTRDVIKTVRGIAKTMERPDFENMWEAVEGASSAVEVITPGPASYVTENIIHGIYDILQGETKDVITGFKKLAGYSEFRAKR